MATVVSGEDSVGWEMQGLTLSIIDECATAKSVKFVLTKGV